MGVRVFSKIENTNTMTTNKIKLSSYEHELAACIRMTVLLRVRAIFYARNFFTSLNGKWNASATPL
jgi:hypothetical protein